MKSGALIESEKLKVESGVNNSTLHFQLSTLILRDYQQRAIEALYIYLRTQNGNPCIVAPTGSGKSALIATICADAVRRWNGRVLVLAHVKELLEQTANTLKRIDPTLDVGIYSAGLRRRDTEKPVIVAGIQSVYRRACELDRFDLIITDECHMLPVDGEGMYRQFLAEAKVVNPRVRLIGLTATPFRLKSGMLCGEGNLLNDVCYEIGIKELIGEGYLSPLRSKASRNKIDTSGLHIRAGEFVQAEVESLIDTDERVWSACRELLDATKDRKSVLIFAVSVAHAIRVKATIEKMTNSECGLVTGETPAVERDLLLRRFKGEPMPADLLGGIVPRLKYLVNVNVLTTGFDAPNIDAIALLRPTASPGLYAQMVGRGCRLADGKRDCLVLDFGGNIVRHGPIDAIKIKSKESDGGGEAPAKECPKCQSVVHAAVTVCPDCGAIFPREDASDKHDDRAANEGILTGEIIDTDYEVQSVGYRVHRRKGWEEGDPETVAVEYQVGMHEYVKEWLCPEHTGWARKKFERFWRERLCKEKDTDWIPDTALQTVKLAVLGYLLEPSEITVRKIGGNPFPSVIDYRGFREPPEIEPF